MEKRTITKELIFLYFKKFDGTTIDEISEFIKHQPKDNDKTVSGKHFLLSYVKFDMNNDGKVVRIYIGLNENGVVSDHEIKPETYYYFRGGSLRSVDDPETINFW